MTLSTDPSSTLPSTTLAPTANVAVVLVEPRIPQNTGNIARLCVCAGLELILVGDLGFRLSDKYLARAGMDYMARLEIRHVNDFNDVLQEKPDWQAFYLSSKAQRPYTQAAFQPKSLLVFGSEDKGLPSHWLADRSEQTFRIPMTPGERSLNLSTSVGIVAYEALRQMYGF
ncbi:MAG: tRNA (cytidine(34)-2'-O)-methyltransferase [Vampirovibrionales bacterium]|nr:tRNA (cytidine(34)-2'-O)-methyltransferase [Vampirovibrionales bacterium]